MTAIEHEWNALGQPVGLPVPDWHGAELPRRDAMSGRFCRVEPLDPDLHAESLFAANALDTEGRNWTYLGNGPFATFAPYRAWLEEVCRSRDPFFFAIVDAANGSAVGVASYLRIDPRSGSIEVGHINFSPLLQRTPAATEALYLLMCNAFDLGYRRYEWKCNALNAPSRSAAQRLGFSFEGIFRQALVVKGRNRDTAWYAIIDQERPALDEAYRRWLDRANFDPDGKQRVSLSSLTSSILKARG